MLVLSGSVCYLASNHFSHVALQPFKMTICPLQACLLLVRAPSLEQEIVKSVILQHICPENWFKSVVCSNFT
jgi:hypothetical protein